MPLEENAKVVLSQSEAESKLEDGKAEGTNDTKEEGEAYICSNQNDEELLGKLSEQVEICSTAQKSLELRIIQTLKENANFQIQVRQNMQKELEEAKKKLSGNIFIPLLKEIAELYSEWKEDIINEMDDGVAKRKVSGVFEVLEEMLEEYGCEFITSELYSKRRPKYSKLKNKVSTGVKEKHETVAKSYNPCIVKEPFVLYPEYVDVYVYDPALPEENKIDENNSI